MKIIERGWAGHLCVAHRCRFKRNTLIEKNGKSVIVSTIGAFYPGRSDGKMDDIGGGRYYETKAFCTLQDGPYIDADIGKEIEFNSCGHISSDKPELLPNNVDNLANDMHDAVVKEISEREDIYRCDEMAPIESAPKDIDKEILLFSGDVYIGKWRWLYRG